jgi:hypothetical protein
MSDQRNTKFKIIRKVSPIPVPQERVEAFERLLAKLVARAIMAEYKAQQQEVVSDD